MDKDIEEIKKRIIKSIKPLKLIENIEFNSFDSLIFPHDSTATFIKVKKRNYTVIVEIMSPVLMDPKDHVGLLELCNSYNLENRFTLVYDNAGEKKSLILRTEFRSEFFNEEDFEIKIRSMKNDAEVLIKDLKPRFLGKTYSEFQGI
jgi:hypothetical protein